MMTQLNTHHAERADRHNTRVGDRFLGRFAAVRSGEVRKTGGSADASCYNQCEH